MIKLLTRLRLVKLLSIAVPLFLMAFVIYASSSSLDWYMPGAVWGYTYDAETLELLDNISLNITGNVSGWLWSGQSGLNPVTGYHGVYNTGRILNWVYGELLTVRIVNNANYTGYSTGIAPPDGVDWIQIDVYAVRIPNEANLSLNPGWNIISIPLNLTS